MAEVTKMTQGTKGQQEAEINFDPTNPEQCSMALAAAAVMVSEKFATAKDAAKLLKTDKTAIEDGLADVMVALLCLSEACEIDLDAAFERKCMLAEQACQQECNEGCCCDHDCAD